MQDNRDRTNQWNADRLRSGVRRVAGISYGDTVPLPDPSHCIRLSPAADVVTAQREMRRYREATISRRRRPKGQPRLESLQGQKIAIPTQEAMPPISLSTPEEEPSHMDFDILRRLLQTPSRMLSKSTSPFASLSPTGASNGLDGHGAGTVSAPPCPTPTTISPSRLPPVRGRLLPMTLARGSRHNLQDSLKTTKLPAIPNGARVWRQNGLSRSNTDLHGFKIYQHLLGAEGRHVGGKRTGHGAPHNALALAQVSGDGVPPPPAHEKTILPVPSFPITQLLAASETTKTPRVDYISINIPLPKNDQSSSSRPESRNNVPNFDIGGASFVPPPSPATQAAFDDEPECIDEDD